MKIKDFYDIVVVGSGPAGGITAWYAARNGASVLILERDREIGLPVRCAEGISRKGLTQCLELDERWIANHIEGGKLYAPNGSSCELIVEAIGDGFILERKIFDSAICQLAAKEGADILTKADVYDLMWEDGEICGVKFNHFTTPKTVRANIVVGADGPESRIGRIAGLKTDLTLNDIESTAQYVLTNISVEPHLCNFYFGNELAPGGYAWAFPKSKNLANVGIGIMQNRTSGKPAKEFLDKFVSEHFPESKVISFVAGSVPAAVTLEKITANHLMLVGDAAHQVNPVTGGGLSNILAAGKITGEVAAEAVKAQDFSDKFLKKYRKIWMKEKGNQQKVLHKLKEIIFNYSDEKLNDLAETLNTIPKEKLTLKELFKTSILEHPLLAAELLRVYL
jgi:digeranylgeranylglycerophospholipid reductase